MAPKRIWTNWKEEQGSMWDKFKISLNKCEEHAELLDTSVTSFVKEMFDSVTGSHLMFDTTIQAVGCLLIGVFGDIQTAINIMINDEHMQKWDTLKQLMQEAEQNNWFPTIPWAFHTLMRRGGAIVTDGKKSFDLANISLKDLDFTYMIDIGKPFIFCEDAVKLEELTEEQKKCYVCVQSPNLPDFQKSMNGFKFNGFITTNGSDINVFQNFSDKGAFVPINKIKDTKYREVKCILPKKAIDMYKLPVVESF